jgi:uncharacterized protein YbaR (Trm112 family)
MDQALLEVLVCPLCKGKLNYKSSKQQLICNFDQLAFPIVDDIPVMLIDDAISLTDQEQSL